MRKLFASAALSAAFFATAAVAESTGAADKDVEFSAQRSIADVVLPRVVCYANDIIYGPATQPDQVEFFCSIDNQGNVTPRTVFLRLINNATGDVFYINSESGISTEIVDIFGNSGEEGDEFAAIRVPDLTQFPVVGAGGTVAALNAADIPMGSHTFAFELRDRRGAQVVSHAIFNICVVERVTSFDELTTGPNLTQDTTLTRDAAYFIDNRAVLVPEGVTLTIEPGTWIVARGNGSVLAVLRGGTIIADGTRARPIVMTSAEAVGQRGRADWGGLVLNGRAPINVPGGEAQSEGLDDSLGDVFFGGNDPADSSGILRFVRVEFAGVEFSQNNELNGIAFQGTGTETVAEYLQVHFNKDDGIEFFGGGTNLKYALLTSIGDDSLDWTDGWIGNAQFVVAVQRGDDADQGLEADNNGDNNTLLPRSDPRIYNVTLIGAPTDADGDESDIGLLLREGTAGLLCNFIVTGFKEDGVQIDQDSTIEQINMNELIVTNSIFYNNNGVLTGPEMFGIGENVTVEFDTADWILDPAKRNRMVNPGLRDPFNPDAPDVRPRLNSPALNVNYVRTPPDNGFFDTHVNYVGGMGPLHDWTKGWTYFGRF